MARLSVVGVRHHSPACARLVRDVVRRQRPRFVLIEGPSDMNGRIDELLLEHTPPVAVFSYAHSEELRRASWSPFCAYSPEWIALHEAKAIGAETLFIDLPAWHDAFTEVQNRYSDRHSRASDRMRGLCDKLGFENVDALWDDLFEQTSHGPLLESRLTVYFRELREGDDAGARDTAREAYMSKWIAWALGEAGDGDVVVVCGGYHAPELERGHLTVESRERPVVPLLDPSIRTGSFVVPYSFRRLDAFVGYEAGMPSPEYYQRVWEDGSDEAGQTMLFRAITLLRKKKQVVSAADAISAMTAAQSLKILRGHDELTRIDVLDGLATAVLKDAIDRPLPWSRRGVLARGTDPMLVAIVEAMSGERTGQLAKDTPRPPLVADAAVEIDRVGLVLKKNPERVTVDLVDARGLERSRVLHRLRVLDVPGFALLRKPDTRRLTTNLSEEWSVARVLEADAALIEAGAYGATLEAAALAHIETMLRRASSLPELATLLLEAARVGLGALADTILQEITRVAAGEPSFASLGSALGLLVDTYRHDVLFGAKGARVLGEAIVASFDRGLWLFEALSGGAPGDPLKAEVDATVALRDALRFGSPPVTLDSVAAVDLMRRRAVDPHAPTSIRGAALGFLWSTRAGVTDEFAREAVRGAGRAETLGDFLTGLFALAREEVLRAEGLVEVIDALVVPMTRDDYLVALPSLRMAFSYFPPGEREVIAKKVLTLYKAHGLSPRDLVRPSVSAELTMIGMRIDHEAKERAKRYGLLDALDEAEAKP